MSVKSVKSSDVFTEEELETITICYGDSKPKGNFIQDRHGFTHYKIDGKEQQGPMVVMSHGLGTSTNAFEVVAAELVNSGFKVLRYDFYGHGYSKYGGRRTYWKYDGDMLVDQLEDLLDYVEQEEVTGVQQGATTIVGHSTGGVVAIEANRRWLKDDSKRDIVPNIILVAPAIYVKKPLTGRLLDRIPNLARVGFNILPCLRGIIGSNYIEASKIAFARDPKTKDYIYPDVFKNASAKLKVLFGRTDGKDRHPFLEPAIFSIASIVLNVNNYQDRRNGFVSLLKNNTKTKTLFIWGKLDETVPYEKNIDEVKKWDEEFDNFELSAQDRLGHECTIENPTLIAGLITSFLGVSPQQV